MAARTGSPVGTVNDVGKVFHDAVVATAIPSAASPQPAVSTQIDRSWH